MKHINVFYIAIIIIGITLWKLNSSFQNEIVLFYGFAENKETEINFNYPTAVGKIHVTEGQQVKKGEPLLDLYRIKAKEVLDDEVFKLEELDSRNKMWVTEKQSDIKNTESQREMKLESIDANIKKLTEERDFQKSLYEDLKSLDKQETSYKPLTNKIGELQNERHSLDNSYNEQILQLENEIKLGVTNYQIRKSRLLAEQQFEEANKIIHNQLIAPSDGIVGSIHCKEEEHIPSYKTLITFYDPNPNIVKGYVHEDLIVHVMLKDSFLIRSIKDESVTCLGEVIGLGSRIVEIPERLRKIPDYKTYGREILVSIPTDNNFLQKEKVMLRFVDPPEALSEPSRKKKLVEFPEKLIQ